MDNLNVLYCNHQVNPHNIFVHPLSMMFLNRALFPHLQLFVTVIFLQSYIQKTFKGIVAILDQNLDHGDFVNICMKLKDWRVLNGHAVMFDTYIMHLI